LPTCDDGCTLRSDVVCFSVVVAVTAGRTRGDERWEVTSKRAKAGETALLIIDVRYW
jgi:hypothetical protein